ncbi:MAG: hypothetical protein QG662_1378 [Pseudomonadota bacterium]|nr:hypothetical protein [Pseudomonadota bacterium]
MDHGLGEMMKNRMGIKKILAAGLVACLSHTASGAGPATPAGEAGLKMLERQSGMVTGNEKQVLKTIESISSLIEQSSASKHIEASGNRALLETRNQAREMLLQAYMTYMEGDFPQALRLLREASNKMSEAARLSVQEKSKEGQEFDNQMASVDALLMAQRRIVKEKNGDPKEIETGNRIEALMREAGALASAGKIAEGREILDRAYVLVRTDIQGLRGGETLVRTHAGASTVPRPASGEKSKQRQDFDNRMASVEALLMAQRRIVEEKKGGAKEKEAGDRIEALMRESAALAEAGKLDQGRVVLDRAYVMVKKDIQGLRGGETLVRTLNFASKEEEYRYEIDRNDTHTMLIDLLLKEKRQSVAGLDEMVSNRIKQAMLLRAMAEAFAAQGDFESGIKKLEESTHEIVHAIRAAGVFIPG